jgi:hypothetical protein
MSPTMQPLAGMGCALTNTENRLLMQIIPIDMICVAFTVSDLLSIIAVVEIVVKGDHAPGYCYPYFHLVCDSS